MPWVRTPPADLGTDELAGHLRRHWALDSTGLAYAPVGFGSHHWWLTTGEGARYFVTVDDVADDSALRAAMATARALRDEAGLAFVVAPRPGQDGQAVQRLAGRWSVAVFPAIDGTGWPSAAEQTPEERGSLVDLLGRLHLATPYVAATARADELAVDGRGALEEAMARLTERWAGGPFSEPARALVAEYADDVRRRLATHDDGAAGIRARDEPWVVTHGEPKPDNWLATTTGPLLVDWDTALLAPAARDLWLVESGTGSELRRYTEVTGRTVLVDDLGYYRLRWALVDVAQYVAWFRGPHERTADSELGWSSLVDTLAELRPDH